MNCQQSDCARVKGARQRSRILVGLSSPEVLYLNINNIRIATANNSLTEGVRPFITN